jgi:hypothetical protein
VEKALNSYVEEDTAFYNPFLRIFIPQTGWKAGKVALLTPLFDLSKGTFADGVDANKFKRELGSMILLHLRAYCLDSAKDATSEVVEKAILSISFESGTEVQMHEKEYLFHTRQGKFPIRWTPHGPSSDSPLQPGKPSDGEPPAKDKDA